MLANREMDRFLRELGAELGVLPDAQRAGIIDDVRAHIVDAVESDRPVSDVLKALGSPAGVAAEYREQLSIPAGLTGPADRAALVLHLATIILGAVTALIVAFVLPSFVMQSFSDNDSGAFINQDYSVSTIAARYGFGAALLTLVPTVFAVLPLVVPRVARQPVAVANAFLMTIFLVVSGFTLGSFYVPMALVMWAAVIVPWRISRRRGLVHSPIWRIIGGVVILLPALLVIAGLVSGSILGEWPLVIVLAVVFALAALFAFGYRLGYFAVAAAGATIMVLGLLDAGFLMIAFWWVGGAWLALGLSAIAATAGTSAPKPLRIGS